MRHIRQVFLSAVVAFSAQMAAAAYIGYCTDNVSRDNIYRVGKTELQGQAIQLSADKLAILKGHSISGVRAAFGSKRTTGGTVDIFVATSPDGEPLAKATVAISSVTKWIDLQFDTPYVITGDEPQLYVGYTAEINTQSSLLMSDFMGDTQGCCYVYNNGEWVDTYGMGYGNALLRAIIPDAPEYADLMIRPIQLDGYFKAQQQYALDALVFNCGTAEVSTVDMAVKVGDAPVEQLRCGDLAIAPNTLTRINLPALVSNVEGYLPVDVQITAVNGGADADPADNKYASEAYFYPAMMERSILLEGFTGQTCSNCPAGHTTIHNFLAQQLNTPVIEVMHHSGYQPDFMSMDADYDYTFLYGSSSTYAPAVMLNRTAFNGVSEVPVMGVSVTNLNDGYAYLEQTQPYVSLALESDFDAATRQLDVKLDVQNHNQLPADVNVLNIMLVQDGIVALQLPLGASYTHNAVMRGVLTGNAWGVRMADNQAGAVNTYTATTTLPEAITSDYYNNIPADEKPLYTFATDIDKMYLVAYVASYKANDVQGHTVYNAVKVPIGGKYAQGGMTSIKSVEADDVPANEVKVVDGKIVVLGEYDTLNAYTIDGRSVDAAARLQKGIYVIKVGNKNRVATQKVIVR